MDRFLICNADDIGISKKITDVIIESHVNGIVSSATIMSNMPAAVYAAGRVKDYPELGVGIHLNLTKFKPVCPAEQVSDLVDEKGNFLSSTQQCRNLWFGGNKRDQVEREFSAQIEKVLDFGIKPTHFDSHHGIQKRPLARQVLIKLAKKYGISAARTHRGYYWNSPDARLRIKCRRIFNNMRSGHRIFMRYWNHYQLNSYGLRTPDRLIAANLLLPFNNDPKQQFLSCLGSLHRGVSEIITHPGCNDPEVGDSEKFAKQRELDARIVMDPEVVQAVKDLGIKLISFSDLRQ